MIFLLVIILQVYSVSLTVIRMFSLLPDEVIDISIVVKFMQC